jgi:hypothetical protein
MDNQMLREELERHSAILDGSTNRGQVAASARALAASRDDNALLTLGQHLRSAAFLDRLDDTSQPTSDIENLAFVFAELTLHPSPASARLCVMLYGEQDFAAIPVRLNFLLAALAAVVPMTEEGAQVFRQSSAEGFAEVNGPLLIQNQSSAALQVFEEIIAGDWVEPRVKVEIIHRSVLPKRTEIQVLATCIRLLDRPLADQVRSAIIETLYDYQPGVWFGPARNTPRPPLWESASNEVLRMFVSLAERLERESMDDALQRAVRTTSARIQGILAARTQ